MSEQASPSKSKSSATKLASNAAGGGALGLLAGAFGESVKQKKSILDPAVLRHPDTMGMFKSGIAGAATYTALEMVTDRYSSLPRDVNTVIKGCGSGAAFVYNMGPKMMGISCVGMAGLLVAIDKFNNPKPRTHKEHS
eukprot:TRINITY_DN15247_c0_g1_i2.p1 TRINITY_DN15247_c0_g1~~TRINITY_DN15247_c0_g1_i2.p1  ORF type:complete len:138 (-),score=34.37 TRINITY_DN15247_c0_g1_i2:23-436(-)